MRTGGTILTTIAVSILGACGSGSGEAPSAQAAAPPAAPVAPATPARPAEAPPDPAAEAVPISRLGVACDGHLPAPGEWEGRWPEARAANAAALELHRAGDFAGSRRGFETALAIDARHDMARFNLACALSRLGDLEGAAREMTTLLEIDLPTFLARLRADPDLEALRGSPEGARIEARAARIREAWEQAIARGLPATFVLRPGGAGQRGGFLIGGRCVPVTDRGFADDYAVLDAARRRFAYIAAYYNDAEVEADETLLLQGAGVVPFALDEGVAKYGSVDEPQPVGEPDAYPRWIDASGADVLFRMEHDWHHIVGERLVPIAGPREPPPRRDERAPEGFALEGNRLRVPGSDAPIELGNGHGAARWHSFALRPDRGAIVVASERVGREPEEIGFEQSAILHALVVDHVDLATRRVTRLVSEPVHGFVVEHEGDLYVSHGLPLGIGGTLQTFVLRYRGFDPGAREELWFLHVLPVTGP